MGVADFEEVLAKKRDIVWPVIKRYLDDLIDFPNFCKISSKYVSITKFHQEIVAEYPERKGKYLRPTLVLLTAEAMGNPSTKAILTAAAMQASEDWLLIHDDIEDDSSQRRGAPTLHRLYGKELAINAGDTVHLIMWKILWDNRKVLGSELASKIADEFYQMLMRTVFGQTVEIKWTQDNRQGLMDEDIFLLLDGKTSYYTIAGPMRLGAILAGATEKQLVEIYEFGKVLGRAFQIVDDLLDLTSDFKGLKKQTGNDIYEGKRTIMLAHLFRAIRGEDKKKLLAIMKKNRGTKTGNEVKWVIEMMDKYGSLEYGRKLAEKFAQEAENIFERKLKFLKQEPARSQIKAGIDFIVKREY